ncbi:MAG: hypothetical protein ACLTK0_03775 [Anaerovoracaceae bacterium]
MPDDLVLNPLFPAFCGFRRSTGNDGFCLKIKRGNRTGFDFNSHYFIAAFRGRAARNGCCVRIDKSTSTVIEDEALEMLKNLQQQADATGARINAGVVIFNKTANEAIGLTELNDENLGKIEAAMRMDISGGTNLHAGILAGKDA